MARWIAQPPKATFVTGLRDGQLPDRPARQLPDQPTTLWVEPSPLVIRAFGAHCPLLAEAAEKVPGHRILETMMQSEACDRIFVVQRAAVMNDGFGGYLGNVG
jgi:hypothetical protein